MNKIAVQEQCRLNQVFQQLTLEQQHFLTLQRQNQQHARQAKTSLAQDASLNMDNISDNLDTFAALEAMNRAIDQFNFSASVLENKLRQLKLLLPAAYFSKINVRFADEPTVVDSFYIGITGYQTQVGEDLVYDWRSPIASLYYDQILGASSYVANGQKIAATIDLRRQFKIDHDQLLGYFDSQLAVEDPLLIEVLAQTHQQYLTDITATIQKEQNAIIRDEQTDALIIRGVAGSGKTSVVIQRIAYLLYRNRQNVKASDVLLLTPNELFSDYVSQVLPTLGEANPWQATFQQLLAQTEQRILGPTNEFIGWSRQTSHLSELTTALANLTPNKTLFKPLSEFIDAAQLLALFKQTPVTAKLADRLRSLQLKLRQLLDQKINAAATNEQVLTALDNLTPAQQQQIFGQRLRVNNDRQLVQYARKLRRYQLTDLAVKIDQFAWLDWAEWLQQLLPQVSASLTDLVFILVRLTKFNYPQIKFLMIDELQDYQLAELQLITELFPHAKMTLLGDENQALTITTPGFDQVAALLQQQKKPTKLLELTKSYRSTQEVTTLFREFAVNQNLEVVSVQRHGQQPELHAATDFNAMLTELTQTLQQQQTGSTAIVTLLAADVAPIYTGLKALAPALDLVKNSGMTAKETVILPLTLAKGLEFDHVLLLDVSQQHLAKITAKQLNKLLYTGISRATKTVQLFASGPVHPMVNAAFSAIE
ncbi:HelD family protein [Loigolactobacillus jiayinensis]|uniref:HelD family protein n=1 Tax=Loigolactobacillus jiayinensis TaxID=2486016 RepID=A0ABW1RAS6_9LACO|nr:UvrD-helicase domain-containing protein [Loigolactobacillus jiayinensis]